MPRRGRTERRRFGVIPKGVEDRERLFDSVQGQYLYGQLPDHKSGGHGDGLRGFSGKTDQFGSEINSIVTTSHSGGYNAVSLSKKWLRRTYLFKKAPSRLSSDLMWFTKTAIWPFSAPKSAMLGPAAGILLAISRSFVL